VILLPLPSLLLGPELNATTPGLFLRQGFANALQDSPGHYLQNTYDLCFYVYFIYFLLLKGLLFIFSFSPPPSVLQLEFRASFLLGECLTS
jgi:hypothetical protein